MTAIPDDILATAWASVHEWNHGSDFPRSATGLATIIARALLSERTRAREEALDEAANAQPSTAENPNESSYQRGRFDGVMEYAAAILALKDKSDAE